ncbi:MAG TPA: hypothetical protein H9743_04470 [Candidatus Mediterraneibacter vanvlietii]|nr:hypothetical protein [Candidatus Mediterraneibacter vanvlietii]
MRKKLLCLAMTAVVAAGATMPVYAEDYQGHDGWLAEFNGDEITSNFQSSDLADDASGIQPGDSIELSVSVENSADTETDWYMTNEIVRTLEDASAAAEGGSYEYRLIYADPSGEETVIYDSTTVGGETENGSSEGLHQIGDTTEEYFYLGRLAEGEAGQVRVWLKVDGETQGNGYQQTLAQLRMNFAVEEAAAGTAAPGDENNEQKTVVNRIVKTIKTGDTTNIVIVSAVALVSGLILLLIALKMLNDRRSRKGAKKR